MQSCNDNSADESQRLINTAMNILSSCDRQEPQPQDDSAMIKNMALAFVTILSIVLAKKL